MAAGRKEKVQVFTVEVYEEDGARIGDLAREGGVYNKDIIHFLLMLQRLLPNGVVNAKQANFENYLHDTSVVVGKLMSNTNKLIEALTARSDVAGAPANPVNEGGNWLSNQKAKWEHDDRVLLMNNELVRQNNDLQLALAELADRRNLTHSLLDAAVNHPREEVRELMALLTAVFKSQEVKTNER